MSVHGMSTGRGSTAGPAAGAAGAVLPGPGEPRGAGPGGADRAGPAAPAGFSPARTRRRPGVLAAGVALVAVGALAAAYLTQVVGHTVAVVAVARSVPAGQLIGRADLTVANVNADPALRPVPADRLASLVGQRAAVDLPAGSLLTADAVAAALQPGAGRSLVGVALSPAQLPAETLRPGDRVRIVATPTAQGEPPSTTPATLTGEVVSVVGPDDAGLTVVNVSVPTGQAANLAAWVGTGRVALVLDSRER